MLRYPPFDNRPLPPGYTRLLKFAAATSPLQCSLETYPTGQLPVYSALSYAPTDENTESTVLCDGRELKVTPDFCAALSQFRQYSLSVDVWLWVDVFCIPDNSEAKVREMKRMSSIFANAYEVIIWLGPEGEYGHLAMDEINRLMRETVSVPPDENARSAWLTRLPSPNDEVWKAIVELYSRPWFCHLRAIQEVIFSDRTVAFYGTKSLALDTIVKFGFAIRIIYPEVLALHGIAADDNLNGFVSCKDIHIFASNVPGKIPTGSWTYFLSILDGARGREVSDPLDHIYGLLGLARDDIRNLVTVKYDSITTSGCLPYSMADSLIDFCKTAIQREPTLRLLSMAPSKRKHAALPTWCPSLNSSRKEPHLYCNVPSFKAGYCQNEVRRCPTTIFTPSNSLKVRGFWVDHVNKVVKRQFTDLLSVPSGERRTVAAQNRRWEAECFSLFQSTCPTDKQNLEKYCRVLIADHLQGLSLPPENGFLRQGFLLLKEFWTKVSKAEPEGDPLSPESDKALNLYGNAVSREGSRKFFSTDGGRIGLGPGDIRAGDNIVVLYSAAPLFVLRFLQHREGSALIGEAYVHGLMDLSTMPADARGPDADILID